MDKVKVRVRYLYPEVEKRMRYATPFSVGIDLIAVIPEEGKKIIPPGEEYTFPTGIAIEILSPGIAGFVFSRSGLGVKGGLVVTQGVGVIDPDYRGEIRVSLYNISREEKQVLHGDRIAQLVFMPAYQAIFEKCQYLSQTQRGEGGFGHTGMR